MGTNFLVMHIKHTVTFVADGLVDITAHRKCVQCIPCGGLAEKGYEMLPHGQLVRSRKGNTGV